MRLPQGGKEGDFTFFGKLFTGKEDKNDRETRRGNVAKD